MIFVFLLGMLLFLSVFAFYLVSTVYGAIRTRVPYVPTSAADVRFLASELPIRDTDIVYDLGSGNGRVVFGIERYSGAAVRGGEMIPYLYVLSLIKRWWYKSRAHFYLGDFYSVPVSDATVVYTYLFPKLLPPVMEKLVKECRPGTTVVSRDFPITGYTAVRQLATPTGHTFYVYTI